MHHNTTDKQLLIRYVDLLENPVNKVTFKIKEICLLMFSKMDVLKFKLRHTCIEPVPCFTFPNNDPSKTGLSFSVPGITPASPVMMFKLVVPSGRCLKNPIWEPFLPLRLFNFAAAPKSIRSPICKIRMESLKLG